MKRVLVAAGLAGLAVGRASGGNIATDLVVSLTFDQSVIVVGSTVTASVWATWNGVPGSYLSSITVDLIASIPGVLVSNIAPVAWNNPALGFDGQGTASGADVLGLEATQFSLIPPFVNTNPILITTFTLTGTCGAVGYLEYSARVSRPEAPGPFSVTGPVFDDLVVFFGEDSFRSERLLVCPSPSAGCLLGMAGVAAGRRRLRG